MKNKIIKKGKFKDYRLIPETAGKIMGGVYLHKDGNKLLIHFAWGDDLVFAPIDELKGRKLL
jgi:hypothetical protein